MRTNGNCLNCVALSRYLLLSGVLIAILLLLLLHFVAANTTSNIVVTGAVEKPGSFGFQRNMRLGNAIRLVGGLAPEAETDNAIIIRKGSTEPLSIDIDTVLLSGSSADIKLMPGDTIYVPQKASPPNASSSKLSGPNIVVAGAVDTPGVFRFGLNATMRDVVKLTTKATPDADTSSVFILRRYVPEALRVDKVMRSDLSANPKLLPEDNVFIPKKVTSSFYVAGSVAKPGVYPAIEQGTLIDALITAGGPAAMADLSRVLVTRSGKAFIVDVKPIIELGQPDFAIEAGDNIYVPARQHGQPKPMQIAR